MPAQSEMDSLRRSIHIPLKPPHGGHQNGHNLQVYKCTSMTSWCGMRSCDRNVFLGQNVWDDWKTGLAMHMRTRHGFRRAHFPEGGKAWCSKKVGHLLSKPTSSMINHWHQHHQYIIDISIIKRCITDTNIMTSIPASEVFFVWRNDVTTISKIGPWLDASPERVQAVPRIANKTVVGIQRESSAMESSIHGCDLDARTYDNFRQGRLLFFVSMIFLRTVPFGPSSSIFTCIHAQRR